MIVFSDVIFPSEVISADQARGKNMRRNSVVETDSGKIAVNVVWTQALREYEVGTVPMPVDQWRQIETLFEITEGGAYGMLLEDPKDHLVTAGALTRAEAGVFQLVKRATHAASTRTKDRNITRPREDGFTLTQGGSPVAHTLDPETGLVTIPSDPDPATLSWAGKFYVPVRFLNDFIEWEIVKSGPAESRYAAGPSVILQEIRE